MRAEDRRGGGVSGAGRRFEPRGDRDRAESSAHLAYEDIPEVPEDVTSRDLDKESWKALGGLSKDYAERVARHLVMAGRLMDEDPELAYRHARTAADRAGRIAIVRETAGIAAYLTGRYAEAVRELRTYARLSGSEEHLPIIADCERGLGRPEKAIEIASGPEARALTGAAAAEMAIVLAGARGDQGEYEAGRVVLENAARGTRDPECLQRLGEAKQRLSDLAAGGDPAVVDQPVEETPEEKARALAEAQALERASAAEAKRVAERPAHDPDGVRFFDAIDGGAW